MSKANPDNFLYVACHRKDAAECFAGVNKVEIKHLRWISEQNKLRGVESINEIWVLSEIGPETAETLDYFKRLTGTDIKYAEPSEKVELNLG